MGCLNIGYGPFYLDDMINPVELKDPISRQNPPFQMVFGALGSVVSCDLASCAFGRLNS